MLGADVRGATVLVLADGGYGGGGLTAARRLHIWGADVAVVLGASQQEFRGVPLHQLTILENIGVKVRSPESPESVVSDLRSADLVLDALIGYSLQGAPREPIASLIRAANAARTPILALDIASGLDGDSGEPYEPVIRAAATLTLPKGGLVRRQARAFVGQLHLADISVPEVVYGRLGLEVGSIFAEADIVAVPLGD